MAADTAWVWSNCSLLIISSFWHVHERNTDWIVIAATFSLAISNERMHARVCLTSLWHAKDLANDWIIVAAAAFLLWSISWTNTFFRWSSSIWYLHDQIQREFNYWLVKKLSSKDCLVLTCAEQSSSYCFNRCLLGFNLFIETSDQSLCLGHVGIW